MKRITLIIIFLPLCFVWANRTRMNVLAVADYIDDPVNIEIFPQHIVLFQNYFYGDLLRDTQDYGIIVAPELKYGGLGIWQEKDFNIGYGINIHKFDIGAYCSPLKDRHRFGFGLGRAFFASRFDLSFILNDETRVNENYGVNLRVLYRKGDFVFVPKYSFLNSNEPYDYISNKIGILLQRLILNEGFVFIGSEYTIQAGAIKEDFLRGFSGLELPLNRTFVFLIGVCEKFDEEFKPPLWDIETGLCLRIREFNFNFHLNKERLFNKEITLFNSFGLDLNFSKF